MDNIDRAVAEITRTRNEDGRGIARVANVGEAVDMAQRLADLGQAQWFRGQIVNYPKLMPSLYRESVDYDGAERAMHRFGNWIDATPGMEAIAASPDAKIAIAQHYGMPSPFIDFTTSPEVAGFFASNGTAAPAHGTESCIYCLSISEADGMWQVRPGEDPERVVIDVPNLWRLEAQHGVFVWCRYDDLNGPFPLDRIVFPYTGPVASPSEDSIYPARESPLEVRLTEYFQAESILKGSAVFAEIRRHVKMNRLTFDAKAVMPEFFVESPVPDASWAESRIAAWLVLDRVVWNDVVRGPDLAFTVNLDGDPSPESVRITGEILAWLQSGRASRSVPTAIRLNLPEERQAIGDRLGKSLQRVWDEMCRLPWTDQQFSLTLGNVVRYFLVAHQLPGSESMLPRERERAAMKLLLDSPVRVEIGGQGNIHTWAWAEEQRLHGAVRGDFAAILRPDAHSSTLGNTFNTLMVARTPMLLFDFDRLCDLFASEMIPSQAVFYPEHPLFVTPARVHVIGPE